MLMLKPSLTLFLSFYFVFSLYATKLNSISIIDKDHIRIHFKDGDVFFVDDGSGPTAFGGATHEPHLNYVVHYGDSLNISVATNIQSWLIVSEDDENYDAAGLHPLEVFRKSKLNGHAEFEWSHAQNDFLYDHTMEHFIYLQLPHSLQNGMTYTLQINPETQTDVTEYSFTYDIFHSLSDAIKVNLAGYTAGPGIKAADLYYWMGDGGARNYTSFEGNKIYLYDIDNDIATEVGTVAFWKNNQNEASGYNLIRSDVWNVDFTGFEQPGNFRLALEGVGCSNDFEIRDDVYFEPFRVSTLGFFYMRIGQDSIGVSPAPRRPLYIPDQDPSNCRVLITYMHPWLPQWAGPGDRWDQPQWFSQFTLEGNPENPYAYGGHSDALDWDRHLAHVSIIWDMLLPFILTDGALSNDDLGIAESGNGIPDIIDEARNEVDFFLRLRHEGGYSQGLSNPNNSNVLFQAGNTPMAAWANALNSAMLAEAFRISGHKRLMQVYADSAMIAFNYAQALDDPWMTVAQEIGEGYIKGRDLKASAAAFLYNVTGLTMYEDIMAEHINITGPQSPILNYTPSNPAGSFNKLYGVAAYLKTPRTVNHPELFNNMRESIIHQAFQREVNMTEQRPSRRATDNNMGYFQTIQNVHRSIVAHAVATDPDTRQQLYDAITLEADWGLGRNPLNIIQMTTATTPLQDKKSIENCYTSGRNDGTPGLHPGHTPYLNMHCWDSSMTMGCPPRLQEKSYPTGTFSWPHAEMYFNTRYVWAHSEFTPQQTMRGKAALYGYLYGLSGAGLPVQQPADPANPFHPHYKISGRTDFDREGGPVLYYPGSYIHVYFEGTSLQATFTDIDSFNDQNIGFIINHNEPIYYTLQKNTTQTFEVASGLQDTIHSLYIFKLDNPGNDVFGLQFNGLMLDEGKSVFPGDDHYNLKLEFYGDSFTAGSQSGPNGEDNGWYSFANVCARILNADIHNNGIDGLAVMDHTGWYQNQTTGLETTYDKLDPGLYNDEGYSDYDFSQFTPDIMVFGFGINDNYGENNAFDDPDQWIESYRNIIETIADIHDKNRVQIVLHPANIHNQAYEYGPQVVRELRDNGYDAYWFRFSFDIDEHPTTQQAQQMGEELAHFIQQAMRTIPIRRIILDQTSIELTVGGTQQLIPTILPANTTLPHDVIWSSDNESIAQVDEHGVVTGIAEGVTIVRATTVEGGKTANASVFVSESVNINEIDGGGVRIFPNPLKNSELQIILDSNVAGITEVRIYCALAKLHHSSVIPANIHNHTITNPNLKPGVYFVEISGKNLHVIQKLIVQ